WVDPLKAPRGEVAMLRAVRIRTKDGQSAEKFDIRKPVGLEMEYDVLKPGYKLMPSIMLWNEEGVCLLDTPEQDPAWRGRVRPPGRYRSTAWIPGNFLAEGTMFVSVALETLDPLVMQFYERQVVAFSVMDTCEGDSARGDFAGKLRGVVRPLLEWTTLLNPGNIRSELLSAEPQTRC
ncbi:MAG: ABC transporter ATP-binding protein, partial [Nitrospira sp.]|nr:ABC transporter ATP-binding protein [Nitrospira sp.]